MRKGAGFAMGLPIGIAMGVALGLALHSVPLGIALGVAIGAALGGSYEAALKRKRDKATRRSHRRRNDAARVPAGSAGSSAQRAFENRLGPPHRA